MKNQLAVTPARSLINSRIDRKGACKISPPIAYAHLKKKHIGTVIHMFSYLSISIFFSRLETFKKSGGEGHLFTSRREMGNGLFMILFQPQKVELVFVASQAIQHFPIT